MTCNVFGISFTAGLASTVGTFISQAYGRKDYELCGLHLNRCRILIVLCFFIVAVPLQFGEQFFLLLNFD
jgi:Na+-driven multidrug efflux pump